MYYDTLVQCLITRYQVHIIVNHNWIYLNRDKCVFKINIYKGSLIKCISMCKYMYYIRMYNAYVFIYVRVCMYKYKLKWPSYIKLLDIILFLNRNPFELDSFLKKRKWFYHFSLFSLLTKIHRLITNLWKLRRENCVLHALFSLEYNRKKKQQRFVFHF